MVACTLVGGALSLKVKPRHPMRVATMCTFAFCVLPFTMAFSAPLTVLAAVAFVDGIAGQVFAVIWYTTLQKKVPAHVLSRVSAYDHLGSIALAPPGIVVAGLLFEELGYRTTLLIAGLAALLPSIFTIAVRDVRMMTSAD